MKKLFFLLFFISSMSYGQNITLHQDQYINSDSIRRSIKYGESKPLLNFHIYTDQGYFGADKSQPFFQIDYGTVALGVLKDSTTGSYIIIARNQIIIYDDNPSPKPMTYANSGMTFNNTDIPDAAGVKKMILMKNVSKNALPGAAPVGQTIFVNDATGGKCPAYSDGLNWRRFSNNSIIN